MSVPGPTAVAFFRNLNLGQGTSPTRAVLLEAFADAGATSALSFQVNGTVAFDPGARSPQQVADDVVRRLTPVCGYADVAIARPLAWLRALDLTGADELSLLDGPSPFPEPLPWTPARGDLTVVRADDRHALSVNHREHRSAATPALEARLGVPVTSRGVATVRRLLARLA